MKADLKKILLQTFVSVIVHLSRFTYCDRFHIEDDYISIIYDDSLNAQNTFTQKIFPSTFQDIKPQINETSNDVSTVTWGTVASFVITKENAECRKYKFQTQSVDSLKVIFNISNLHLYGDASRSLQVWPIESQIIENEAFVTDTNTGQGVVAAIWYTSNGFYLSVDNTTPLFRSISNDELTLAAQRTPPYMLGKIAHLRLTYKVCKYPNVKIAYQKGISNENRKPTGVPDYRMVQLPIWTTWVKYKRFVTADKVREFANLINQHRLPNSQLEIDDNWETCYGSLTPNSTTFPNMRNLVSELKTKGFRVTLWTHPFINTDCEPYFTEALKNDYFVKRQNGTVQTAWWRGEAGIIDFTNPEAARWWQERVENLRKEIGVDSFKFDSGESSINPQPPVFRHMADDYPETNLKEFIKTVSIFGNMIEVRTGRETQQYPIFLRINDRNSTWQGNYSIATIIPEVLHLNVIGYPFIIPDIIGGNTYVNNTTDAIANIPSELFVRWVQLNVFMPVLQFSVGPWEYDEQIMTITKKYIDLHKNMTPIIYDLMKRATTIAAPVNAPMWWADPDDPVTYTIDSQFLLGDDILVAPVLKEGATSRDIYLPKGKWLDKSHENKNTSIQGPIWLRNYPAGIEILPYFMKVSTPSSNARNISPTFCLVVFLFLFSQKLGMN